MPHLPIPAALHNTPQPVHPDALAPHIKTLADHVSAIRSLCLDTTPDGAITGLAAQAIASTLRTIRETTDAIAETLRLNVTALDCVAAVAATVSNKAITEADLYKTLARRGFRAADIRPAVLALVEHGDIIRTPNRTSDTKRGPTPHILAWRKKA